MCGIWRGSRVSPVAPSRLAWNHPGIVSARHRDVIADFSRRLERAMESETQIVGVAEIGSFAKGEAVSTSDHDLRVYAIQPHAYVRESSVNRFIESRRKQVDEKFDQFLRASGVMPARIYDRLEFNDVFSRSLSEEAGCSIEFGLCDFRFAQFEFESLHVLPTIEHQILLRSDILHDPNGVLAQLKRSVEGKKFAALAELYSERYLKPPFELYAHLRPESHDESKSRTSGQIQWVKWAVCAVRDAVWALRNLRYGENVYRKPDVLQFIDSKLPQHSEWVHELYAWKTDERVRKQMVESFLEDSTPWFERFQSLMPKIEAFYPDLLGLELR